MIRDKEKLTKTSYILLLLLTAKEALRPLVAYPTLRSALYSEYTNYIAERRLESQIRRLMRQGWIRTEYVEAKRFFKLTKKGYLKALLSKIQLEKPPKKWDKRWRIIMFDIPENTREIRAEMRDTLKAFGYFGLQASVYVHPFPLQGSAIELLKSSGLIRYIRIARADIDDDSDLQKRFKKII